MAKHNRPHLDVIDAMENIWKEIEAAKLLFDFSQNLDENFKFQNFHSLM
jgi:hypothetical protein